MCDCVSVMVCVCACVIAYGNGVWKWHGGSVACTACTAASQQEGHGLDSRMGRCWLWGAGLPQTFSAQVGYLPGLSVWSLHVLPVVTRGFLHYKPQQQHMNPQPD